MADSNYQSFIAIREAEFRLLVMLMVMWVDPSKNKIVANSVYFRDSKSQKLIG